MAELPPVPHTYDWLIDAALQQAHFRQIVRRHTQLFFPHCMVESVMRYEQLWMPLMNRLQVEHETAPMDAAPLDIAWLWHCHMLDPVSYKDFCTEHFGRLVGRHQEMPTTEQYRAMQARWEIEYPGKPFEIIASCLGQSGQPEVPVGALVYAHLRPVPVSQDQSTELLSALGKELLAVIPRHGAFIYQLSQPYSQSSGYLRAALQRYYALIQLKGESPDIPLALACDISAIMMAHQCAPQRYQEDLSELICRPLITTRGVQSVPTPNASADTANRWTARYGTQYYAPGTIFRASLPPLYVDVIRLGEVLTHYGRGSLVHHITEVAVTLGDRNRRHLQATLTHGSQKSVVTLNRDKTTYLTWRGPCAFPCTVDMDRIEETPKLQVEFSREHHLRRGSVSISQGEVTLEASHASPQSAEPLELVFPDCIALLVRKVEFQPKRWEFFLKPQEFSPIDASQLGQAAPALSVDGHARPPVTIRSSVGLLDATCVPRCMSVHPVYDRQDHTISPTLWCSVTVSSSSTGGKNLTDVRLVDSQGTVVGLVRNSLPNEWPTRAVAESWGAADWAVEVTQHSVVVAFEGKDWALLRGQWDEGGDAPKLELVPMQALTEVLAQAGGGPFKFTYHGEDLRLEHPSFGDSPAFKLHLPSGHLTIGHPGSLQLVTLWLLVAYGAALLRSSCYAACESSAQSSHTSWAMAKAFHSPSFLSPVINTMGSRGAEHLDIQATGTDGITA